MTEQQIIDELDSIISYCEVTREKATGLRRKLEKPSRKRRGISDQQIAKILAARTNYIIKKSLRANEG
jgi:predicted nucleic acid-binding protein